MTKLNTPTDFWARVDRSAGDGKCWPWMGSKRNGYGQFKFQGRNWSAHRLSYHLTYGYRGDLFVCHSCDNRLCCNPAHLFLGTNSDNQLDAVAKGRHRCNFRDDRIERVRQGTYPRQKLTVPQVQLIRDKLRSGKKHRDIAAEFGVSRPTITAINAGRIWAHLP